MFVRIHTHTEHEPTDEFLLLFLHPSQRKTLPPGRTDETGQGRARTKAHPLPPPPIHHLYQVSQGFSLLDLPYHTHTHKHSTPFPPLPCATSSKKEKAHHDPTAATGRKGERESAGRGEGLWICEMKTETEKQITSRGFVGGGRG